MPLNSHRIRAWFGQAVVAGIMLAGLALFAGAPSAKANDGDDCNRKINYANWRLHEAIEDYGYSSPQANYWRHELHEVYEHCRESRDRYDYNRDRDDRWSDSYRSPGRYGDDDSYRNRGYSDAAFDSGFRDGMSSGLKDLRQGKSYQPQRHDAYEDADRGYNRSYGDKSLYKQQYREGFLRGYHNGFYNGWR